MIVKYRWYKHRFGKQLNRDHVPPVQHALQGHPESGMLWERHISGVLSDLGFKHTTHDRSIYSADWNGAKILLLRQVDDFALASPHEDIAKDVCNRIGRALQLPSEKEPPFSCLGLLDDFNGLDVHQHNNSIEISCQRHRSIPSFVAPSCENKNLCMKNPCLAKWVCKKHRSCCCYAS